MAQFLTPYQLKYFAHILTRKTASNDKEKLMGTILDAKVDPKPHQIESANFAFQSPFSKGIILADEVGLGKTIEAGIILSQYWAEGKQKLLIIAPANLRQQWSQELREKFFLDSEILDSKKIKIDIEKKQVFAKKIVYICSYDFARRYSEFFEARGWDLVVIDEAHRLRNVYKKDSPTAQTIKKTFAESPKLLLTATPLQNSLLELYGLVSIIDQHFFGDFTAFKDEYVNNLGGGKAGERKLLQLRQRLQPLVNRNLRQNVQEYINYTKRHPHTEEFEATQQETELYDKVTCYLNKEKLYAFSKSQRNLITLLLLKLLGSSSHALSITLFNLANRLQAELQSGMRRKNNGSPFDEDLLMVTAEDGEISEDFLDDETEQSSQWTEAEKELVEKEIEEIREMADLAESIKDESKAKALLKAVQTGFNELEKIGAPKKTIIFTESTRTQEYLVDFLEKNGYQDQIVRFNGSGGGEKEREIYLQWLEKNKNTDNISGVRAADRRKALVDYFRDEAQIMVATEAAGEGINLQFCSMVINYDLPWNPQRVEQRIGRVHRYGQKFDVIVFNFLNRNNYAERRILQLLTEKFNLFSGVFGASDQVLGAIESGFDFETQIANIIQTCRTNEEIENSFNRLQDELSEKIGQQMGVAKKTLFDNFDSEVAEKLRISRDENLDYLNRYQQHLWQITHTLLQEKATFATDNYSFRLSQPLADDIPAATYVFQHDGYDDVGITYRLQHPLAKKLINESKTVITNQAEVHFDLTHSDVNVSRLKPLLNHGGNLFLYRYALEGGVENQEYFIFIWQDENGDYLDSDLADRMFDLPATVIENQNLNLTVAKKHLNKMVQERHKEIEKRNQIYLKEENTRVENWADDVMRGEKMKINKLDKEIKNLRQEARLSQDTAEELHLRQQIRKLSNKLLDAEDKYRQTRKELNTKIDEILDTIEAQLKSKEKIEEIFAIKWYLS